MFLCLQCGGRCSKDLTGTQTRTAQCEDGEGQPIREKLCFEENRPKTKRSCKTKQCEVKWKLGEWKRVSIYITKGQNYTIVYHLTHTTSCSIF